MMAEDALARATRSVSKAEEFESLVRRYERSIYSIALRMTANPEEAKDLAQEAFVRAFRSFDSYRRGTSFDRWLYRIVTNLYIDQTRKRKRTPILHSLDEAVATSDGEYSRELPDESMSPETVIEQMQLDHRVKEALLAIPAEFRMAIVLCDIEGFSYEEIAQIMGTSIGTVRSRIHRARRGLRDALAPHYTHLAER